MADKPTSPGHSMFGLNDEGAARPTEQVPTAVPNQTGAPQYVYVPPQAPVAAGGSKGLTWVVVLLALLAVANLAMMLVWRSQFADYANKQADEANLLTRRLDASDARYAQLRGQFQVTSEKLGLTEQELSRAHALAADVQKQQQAAVAKLNDAIAKKASTEEMNKLQADANNKITGLGTDLEGTKADLANTKSEFTKALTGTKGELKGDIARTHDDLVALAHKTDRDYFEFNLARKKAQQKLGTVTVELEKTDPKKNTFSVFLYFDDKRTERKDKGMAEPLYFYVQGAPSALELVVNKLGKDTIAGYMSAPKGFIANIPNVLSARPGA